MKEGDKYIHTNRFNQTFILTYLGGATEIKEVKYHCFKEEHYFTGLPKEAVILLTESDLKDLKKVN